MADRTVRRYRDPARFQRDVEPFLLVQEAANGLPLGLLRALQSGEYRDPYLAAVTRRAKDGRTVLAAVAMRAPPYHLILCEPADRDALPVLADDVSESLAGGRLPGVLGPEGAAKAFAKLWADRTGAKARLEVAQRIYRCDRVEPVTGVPGRLRLVVDADRPLVRAWALEFHDEALPGTPFDADEATERWFASPARSLYLWEDRGNPVSMVGASGPTPNAIRISAVYTPAEHRRRGYASAATAELTQRLLAEGRAFTTLFTDLSNPTSNAIYQRIGYRPVLDFPMYGFEGP